MALPESPLRSRLQSRTPRLSRRSLLVGGGAGVGLIVAWAVWPRTWLPNLTAGKDEQIFGAWLKIGKDGHVTVVVPQVELGQGVWTVLPQILADELGANWREVGVESAPLNPLYANPIGAAALFADASGGLPKRLEREPILMMVTGGSSSVRNFEGSLRQAGAAARVLLCKAAARRWSSDWRSCNTADGFVVHGDQKLDFGALAEAAAHESLPADLPWRAADDRRLYGQNLPRLDAPAKVDGSLTFVGDVRLPGMVFASIRQGPVGDTSLSWVDQAAANTVKGCMAVITAERWVAAIGNNWWAADHALNVITPRFQTRGDLVDSESIDDALNAALEGDGDRLASAGDLSPVFKDAKIVTADYRVGLALHAALEPMTATAHYSDGKLRLWLPTQAPALARAAAARASGLSEERVIVHPAMAGGSFGRKLEQDAVEQVAILARRLEKPVQFTWSRVEDFLHDRFRPAAAGRLSARLGEQGQILGWLAKIAAPATAKERTRRIVDGETALAAMQAVAGVSDAAAVAGAVPIYHIPNMAVDHHPALIGVPTGHWRSDAHSYTCFFTECFMDELAHVAGVDAHGFRIALLGDQPRLARCLAAVAELGGWQGGGPGSGQGIACHSFYGSHIAVLAEVGLGIDRRIQVRRLVAAVDCGRIVNPDVARQQIEGGMLFGMAAALGGSTGFTEGLADTRDFGDLDLPLLRDAPNILVELIHSESDPGGIDELGVPAVAPAIANALQSATGMRLRSLPLIPDT